MMCLVQAADGLSANVYVWTDENGVKHYSNVAPPESAGDAVDQVDELSGEGQVSEQPSIQQSLGTPDAAVSGETESAEREDLDSEESGPADLQEDTAAEDQTEADTGEPEDTAAEDQTEADTGEPEDTDTKDQTEADTGDYEDTDAEDETETDTGDYEDTDAEDETETDTESSDSDSSLLIHGETVEQEKDRTRQLLEALSEGNQSSQDLIENEKKRLEQIIADLQQQPLARFGSQMNKQRQIGFYQNRLQQLISSPEIYLQYGEEE
jgi:hypothetical protein